MRDPKNKKLVMIIFAVMIILTAATVGGVVAYGNMMFRIIEDTDNESIGGKHYAFICETPQDGFYRSIYEGAYREAEASGDYLENMGENIAFSQNKYELMELSIDAGVDGIVVEAGESEAMNRLIERADLEGIPVVTVGSDSTSSARKSYVGFGYYDLGMNYGKELLKTAADEPKRVLVLMSPEADDSSQNIIFQGIRETIERSDMSSSFKLETLAVPDTSAFGAEERISALIMRNEDLPDVIICLNEIFTTCVSQALVDYNSVGQTTVYGFYENSTILSAIQKNIIFATFTMNTEQMGSFCIKALKEYEEYGNVNEYLPVDIRVVTADNINDYIKEKNGAQEDDQI
ncbi:MAG: substrate-binding domain-containing protein [Lachnospiraceae bacterium]|nr:substrate-binding domain-containing protein [Lachnospiraceae bacterium]